MKTNYEVIVVGAGFAGLYMLHKLRTLGFNTHVYEAGSGVGGTWYWNRYPGARCDAQSIAYSYTFDEAVCDEWQWSERYATQPEILRYLNFIADRLNLRHDIDLNSRVTEAFYDADANSWDVTLEDGRQATCTYLVMASGALSTSRLPDIAGRDTFAGQSYHTGAWPHEGVDFTGKRVAVIGTGSSGLQAIPLIAKEAQHLTVVQRTPAFSAPARNAPITPEEARRFKENHAEFRHKLRRGEILGISDVILADHLPPTLPSTEALSPAERDKVYEDRWAVGGGLVVRSFEDTLINETANQALADFFRAKIRSIVKDPQVAEALSPKDYPIGTKRLCCDTDYYETFNRDNVLLVDLQTTPIESITPRGIRTTEREYEFDCIVYATGFDAMTGALLRIDIRGKHGLSLRDEWRAGPWTYLGVSMAGFPNLFTITGPGSPSVLSNVVHSIEQHVEWISDLLVYAREHGLNRIEAEADAQRDWTNKITAIAAGTLMMKGKSWYMGANVPGKPQVFMPYIGGVGSYRDICDAVARDGYSGFRLSRTESRVDV